MQPGSIVRGTIVQIDHDWAIVNAGLKSEGVNSSITVPQTTKGELELSVGDEADAALDAVEDGFVTRLSIAA